MAFIIIPILIVVGVPFLMALVFGLGTEVKMWLNNKKR
jgi:hypothetical protein